MRSRFLRPLAIAIVILAVVFGVYAFLQNKVEAYGQLVVLSDQVSRHKISTASDHTIIFKVATTLNEDDYIVLDFDYNATNWSIPASNFDFNDIDFAKSSDNGATYTDYTLIACTTSACTNVSTSNQIGVWLTAGDTAGKIYFKFDNNAADKLPAGDYVRILIGTVATGGSGNIGITNPSAAGGYTLSIKTYSNSVSEANLADAGQIGLYVNNDDQVIITATVDPTLTFKIRTTDDVADTNTCSLGTLSTGAVSTCGYRIAVGTNASSGFTVNVWDINYATPTNQQGLRANSFADEITPVTNDTTVTLGNEQYGMQVTGASGVTLAGTFTANDSPVPTGAAATAFEYTIAPYQYTPLTLTTSTLVVHKAAISSSTKAGYYTQTLRYTATGNF